MNYKIEQENKVRKEFQIFLEAYSYRQAKSLAQELMLQCDCYRRELEARLAKAEGK